MLAIRPYAPGDAEALGVLCSAQYGGDRAAASAYHEHLVGVDGGTLLVAVLDDTLAGYVRLGPPHPAEDGASRYALLSDLYVAPAQRRRGLGAALTRAAEARARAAGVQRVALKVMAGNAAAAALYAALGYRERFAVLDRALD